MERRWFLSAFALLTGVAFAAPQTPAPAPKPEPVVAQPKDVIDIQMRVMRCSAAVLDGIPAGDCAATTCQGTTERFLNEQQVAQLIETANANSRCRVIATPRVLTIDGCPATFLAGQPVSVVAAVRVSLDNGQVRAEKECQLRDCGLSVRVVPQLSADRRFIRMSVTAENNELAANSPVVQSVRVADQVVDLCQPAFNTQQVQFTAQVATGKTLLVQMPPSKCCVNESCDERVCLFVTPCVAASPAPVAQCPVAPCPIAPCPVAFFTPQILPVPTVEEPSEPRPPVRDPNPTLTKLLAKYDRACADGDTEKARKLARRCLDIDPTCFGQEP